MSVQTFLREGETAAHRYALKQPRTGPHDRAGAVPAQRAGPSLEFRDHRGYEPGDDLRYIDWNAYARSDQLIVKLYREEVSPHLDLLLDGTRSMALDGTEKARAALSIAGFFAELSMRSGFSYAGWLLKADASALGGRGSPAWDGITFDGARDPSAALAEVVGRLKPRGIRVLVSDLLWTEEPLRAVRQLADRAAGLVVVQVLAAVDAGPPVSGFVQLIDSETGEPREVRVDADRLKRYRQNLARLQGHWQAACRAAGAVFATVIAEHLVTDWRLDALVAAGILEVA